MLEEKIIAVVTGKEPCPEGYEVLKIDDMQWQIWDKVQNNVYCWVEKRGEKFEIIA